MMKIAVVGSGYVGLVAAACLTEIGHDVICVDNDEKKVAALKAGEPTMHEEFLPELLTRSQRLSFTTSLKDAVDVSEIVFIAVGTPPCEAGEADVSGLELVCREIAPQIDGYKVIVTKSTVPVGTNGWIRRVLVRCGAPRGSFDVASNPEFLREGTAVTDFLYPDRIVIGAESEKCAELMQRVYEPLTSGRYARSKRAIPVPDGARIPAQLLVTSPRSAEIIKHASNSFLAMKISFVNAVANVCELAGADIQEVVQGIGSDQRIGSRFLNPGIGYGGSCFPKDLSAFNWVARDLGYDFRLLDEVTRINEEQRQLFVRKVRDALWTLKNKRIAVLGLAYKGGTDDIRESPAIAILHMLLKEKCHIVAYDPAAMERAKPELQSDQVEFAEDSYAAAQDADALLVLTDWEEFGALDFKRLKKAMKHPVIIDGRNLFSRETMANAGFSYFSVGRQETTPTIAITPNEVREQDSNIDEPDSDIKTA
jgi:UDPglucose 6-dehydrogenase